MVTKSVLLIEKLFCIIIILFVSKIKKGRCYTPFGSYLTPLSYHAVEKGAYAAILISFLSPFKT